MPLSSIMWGGWLELAVPLFIAAVLLGASVLKFLAERDESGPGLP